MDAPFVGAIRGDTDVVIFKCVVYLIGVLMCGFCGIFEYARTGPSGLQAISAMTDALAHRGPDGEGTWCRERLALGHRRLSIFDLSERGAQPMLSNDGRQVIAYNGEVYNFKELRQPLEQQGYVFRTDTDTEVILAQYQRYGIDGIGDLRGMFAFALWDENEQALFLVRDRLGIKPLYYFDRGGLLLFASEIKALLRHPEVTAELDRSQLWEWLALRYTVAPNTLFKGIHKLEPGCYLKVNWKGVVHQRYWDINFEPVITDRTIAVDGYRRLLKESVNHCLRADVPVGVFLSGGLDSSVVALEAAEQSSHRVQTFTVGFLNHPEISELAQAKAVAKFIDADHHELLLDDVEPDLLAKVVAHLEEPIGDPAALLLFQLAKLTRRHVTVALTGEGSDETNLGYSKAAAFARWAELRKTPVIGRILEAIWLRRWTRGGRSGSRLGITLEDLYAELSWPGLPRATLKNADSYGAWSEGLRRVLSACPSGDQLSRLLYLDLKCWMADDLLLKVDKTTMAHGLEARVPFLDHALVEWNMRIPPVWKLGSTGNKLFLRELMKDRLSAATVSRPQHGFLAPLANWFSGDWSTYLDRMLGEHGLARREVIPAAYLSSVRRGLAAGEQQFLLPAFMLAALECWIQEFRVTT